MKVLIVEDSPVKLKALSDIINAADATVDLKHATDVGTARTLLRSTQYDLLVLDVAIPMTPGGEATMDGGLAFFDEINNSSRIQLPSHIVGVTAFEDVFEVATPRFATRSVSLIYYSPSTSDWKNALEAIVWFAKRSAERAPEVAAIRYQSDLAIVCALRSPELRAVLANGWTWQPHQELGDPTIYYKANFIAGDRERVAIAAATCFMGMPATAVLATKMIYAFRPQYLAMCGITATVQGKGRLGDVLIANPTWDWGSGKQVEVGDGDLLEAAPAQIALNPSLREKFQFMSSNTALLDKIRSAWADAPPTTLTIVVGPIASGASVVESSAQMDAIRSQHRYLVGVEMEAYGLYLAAEEAPEPRPIAFAAKAAVDFGIPGKNDQLQAYAAFTSASVVKEFAEGYLWNTLPSI